MNLNLALIERWLAGRSRARGLPLPVHAGGGLLVEVGSREELRRHVFLDAGAALRACAARIQEPNVFLKAAVAPERMRAALPPHWHIGSPGYLMSGPPGMAGDARLPPGYRIALDSEYGGRVVRVFHGGGELAAVGRVALHAGCAVFDQVVTDEKHRRLGLGTLVMRSLDAVAGQAGATERLLVATDAGRLLYERLGWQVLAPWSTAARRAG